MIDDNAKCEGNGTAMSPAGAAPSLVEPWGPTRRHITRRVARMGAAGSGMMVGMAGVLLALGNSELPFSE
jgi:hypothetical protein